MAHGLGLGRLKKPGKDDKKSNQPGDEGAAELLKKMDEKADAGVCPFC